MKFRQNIKEYLQPLMDNDVVIHYPFFANVYVLPYFYSKIIQENNKQGDFIKLSEWGKDANTDIIRNIENDSRQIHLFYSLDIGEKVSKSLNTKSDWYYKKVLFCKYYPMFIFFDFSVDTFLKFYEKEKISKYNSTSDFLTEHFVDIIPEISFDSCFFSYLDELKVESINIYSDTPEEADIIKEMIDKSQKKIKGKRLPISVVREFALRSSTQQNSFNIYYYSAPYNIIFLQNKYQYLPFKIKVIDVDYDKFSTYAFIIGKKVQEVSNLEEIINNIGDKTEEFFQYVFWKAKETPEHFAEVTESFNKHSAIIHPSIIFDNEYSFAKCLSLHVDPESINEPIKINKEEKRISKRLVFESLFGYAYSHNIHYYQEKELLLSKNIKQVYSLIALNYLMDNTEKISSFKEKSFTSICEALNDATFNEGFYDRVFNCFTEIQVEEFIVNSKKIKNNPICDAIDLNIWNIDENKIKHRLVAETKYYFDKFLIKECMAEDIFLVDTDKFELQRLFDLYKSTDTILSEKKASITYLKDIFNHVLIISSNYYDDIVASNIFNLSSTFKNTEVKNLILSKTLMIQASYKKNS